MGLAIQNYTATNPANSGGVLPAARRWSVAYTHARAEKVFRDYLLGRKVPCFLPLTRRRRIYGRHIRNSEVPLFSGYVFYDAYSIPRQEVFQSRKVAQILEPPDPLQLQDELASLAIALCSDEPLRPSRYRTGMAVRVARGPLRGLEGALVRNESECLLILRISFLGCTAELKIDEAYVEASI